MNSIVGLILAVTLAIPVTSFAQESPQSSAAEESLPNTAESVAAQSDDADTAEFQRIVQLAVLQPDTAEFDDAWSDYIKRIHRPDTDVDATVDKVIKAANEFRRSIRVPGTSGSRPQMSAYKMRDKMHALADAVIEEKQNPVN